MDFSVTFTDFFLEIISSFTALRASVESSPLKITHARFAGVTPDHQERELSTLARKAVEGADDLQEEVGEGSRRKLH